MSTPEDPAPESPKEEIPKNLWQWLLLKGDPTEFFKYPIILLCIILVIGAVKLFNVEVNFEGGGIKAVAKKADTTHKYFQKALISLNTKIDSLEAELQESKQNLRSSLDGKPVNPRVLTDSVQQKLINNVGEKTEIASDNIAQTSVSLQNGLPSSTDTKTFLKDVTGVIWIGNYSITGWKPSLLGRSLQTPLDRETPNSLASNQEFFVLGNVILRASFPEVGNNYFRKIPSRGIIPKGTKVKILSSAPKEYKTSRAMQYWVEVRVLE